MNELIKKYIGGIQRHQLQIETLTPLAIRSGEVLSPLTDYHIEGNKLYLLDTDKLMNDIVQNKWLDEFEKEVFEYSGNHSGGTETGAKKKNYFIADFLKEKGASIKPYLQKEKVRACQLKTEDEWVKMHSTIKTGNQAYIPGSSIKGAIRTAIMYHWLTETDEGKKKLEDFVQSVKFKLVEKIKARQKISEANYKAREKNRITEEQKNVQKNIEAENRKSIISCFNEFENEMSTCIFGDTDGKYNVSSFFKVDDSSLISEEKLTVASLRKKYRENSQTKKKREKKKQFSPSLQELIDVNTHVHLNINFPQLALDKKILQKLETKSQLHINNELLELFKVIKHFNIKYLEKEIGRLKGFQEEGKGENKGKSYNKSGISNLHNQLNILRDKISSLHNNETLLCIGFGKSVFLNTLMMTFPYNVKSKKENSEEIDPDDVIRNVVRILHPYHPANKYFPISYYTTEIDSVEYPLGWIKITDKNIKLDEVDYELENYNSSGLKKGDEINGILISRDAPVKVQLMINSEKKNLNANGLSKYEKFNDRILMVGESCQLQVVSIKDGIIKDLKFV